jgi:hypothetical protein
MSPPVDEAIRRQAPEGQDPADTAGVETAEADDRRLFAGDQGRFPMEVRSVLVRLLRGPYLDRSRSELWLAMLTHKEAVRQWLGEIFLELVIDESEGVAYTRQIRGLDLPMRLPVLLRPVRLAYFEAVMLLILRSGTSNRRWTARGPWSASATAT